MNRYINANGIGGGIVLAGRSKIAAQAYSISQRKASELGIQSAYKCNFPFLKVYESTSEKVTLACAAAEITELITHIPEDESKDLNQISVRERLAGANGFPECTMVIPPEKMDLIRARINSGK